MASTETTTDVLPTPGTPEKSPTTPLRKAINREAFSEVSKALKLNLTLLSESITQDEKKILAMNFNNWLIRKDEKGLIRIQNQCFPHLPEFIPGLRFDCDRLDFQFNDLESLSPTITELTRLTQLNLSNNKLKAKFPESLQGLNNLECLFLSNNQISRIPKSLYDIGSSLIWLDLQDNSIDLIPEEFCEKFAKLRILDLRNNYLPYLPEKIGELTSLHSLFLSGNIFIEPLPPSIFTLNLTHLYLQGTVMSKFPTEICSLKQLERLDVSHNSIHSLPNEIMQLINLKYFNFSHNQINFLSEHFGWLISLDECYYHGRCNTLDNIPKKSLKSFIQLRYYCRNQLRKDPMNRATMFEELETTNNIRYYENEGDDEKVDPNDSIRGGSIEKLVQRLTHDELALNNFTRCFLLLYPSFCTSRQLLELLIIRYNYCTIKNSEGTIDIEKQKGIRNKVMFVLSKWLVNHPNHFTGDTELIAEVGEFINILPENDTKVLISKYYNKIVSGKAKPKKEIIKATTPPPKPILPPPGSANLTISSIDPIELARQLCLIEQDLFSQIQPNEFLNSNWTKTDKQIVAPNLTRYINYFNKFSTIVTSTILKYKDTKQRVQILSLFLVCAEECRQQFNFNTLLEIVAALESTPIHRLKVTWKLLSNKMKAIWDPMQKLMQMENNAKEYRRQLNEGAGQPRVPHLASLLKDLTFLNDGNLDILGDNPELINFGKLRKLEEIMEQIQTFQKYKYNFEKSQLIQNIVLTSDHWDDSKNYAESLICEDREGKTAAMRGEVVTEHNDIVINLDVNLTPEQLEAAEKTHHQWHETQVQLGLTTTKEVAKSGYLMLRENSAWKRMWFTLQYPALYYYEKQTDKRPTGVINLVGVTVEMIGKKRNFVFFISYPKKNNAHALKGDTDKETQSWNEELCKIVTQNSN